ncbi:MAG: hypothetical protein EP336_01305 [Rhodobacteraceae bacterium]|nr:MAG: hypothetical protein EP336_01305 [Paracoccaceae bacterium]
MENDVFFQYLKLFTEYVPLWVLLLGGVVIWLIRHPEKLEALTRNVESAKIGEFEIKLREVKEKLETTQAQVEELEAENTRLTSLYNDFDANAGADVLHAVRQQVHHRARELGDLSPVREGLRPGAEPEEIFVAAEMLRERRDIDSFEALIDCIARIAADPMLEGLRFKTVWSLASAVHKTVLSDVSHNTPPRLTVDQLKRARHVMESLMQNAHVQEDRPDAPQAGIRGPAQFALNWIEKGLKKHERAGGAVFE